MDVFATLATCLHGAMLSQASSAPLISSASLLQAHVGWDFYMQEIM